MGISSFSRHRCQRDHARFPFIEYGKLAEIGTYRCGTSIKEVLSKDDVVDVYRSNRELGLAFPVAYGDVHVSSLAANCRWGGIDCLEADVAWRMFQPQFSGSLNSHDIGFGPGVYQCSSRLPVDGDLDQLGGTVRLLPALLRGCGTTSNSGNVPGVRAWSLIRVAFLPVIADYCSKVPHLWAP